MGRAVRNFGQTGLVSTAVSAAGVALWDLKAHGTREITHQEQ
jgi:L-alanine-DL-glutamate epimerase-like enolase superfamily enzyme